MDATEGLRPQKCGSWGTKVRRFDVSRETYSIYEEFRQLGDCPGCLGTFLTAAVRIRRDGTFTAQPGTYLYAKSPSIGLPMTRECGRPS